MSERKPGQRGDPRGPEAEGGGESTSGPTRPEDSLVPSGLTETRTTGAAGPLTKGIPETIGQYRLLGRLGEGGMGVVYEAEQQQPRRRVALKVVRGGQFVDQQRVRMFQREAETLARLKHPTIGAIYESGCTPDGQHFFAMELVRGDTLDGWLKKRSKSPTPQELSLRLGLFRKIAEAVHYAHQRGVIHRDLKPSNIIVTEEAARDDVNGGGSATSDPRLPEIKILDFGLARITEKDVTATTMTTEVGTIKGTLPYMSPEQARGNPQDVDARADVYALGVILYELLTGRRPYEVLRKSLPEAVRVICEESPRPLRQSWSGARRLDPDIETIVGKALDKEPERRYSSAAALSEDIERHLRSQPILARPPGAAYRFRKFVQRNRLLVSAATTVFVALALGLVATTAALVRARAAEQDAKREAYFGNLRAADLVLRSGDVLEAREHLAAAPSELRGWEWGHLDLLAHATELEIRLPVASALRGRVAFVDNDTRLVATTPHEDHPIHLFDATMGEPVPSALTPPGKDDAQRKTLACSLDGRWWVQRMRDSGETVLYDAADSEAKPKVLVRTTPGVEVDTFLTTAGERTVTAAGFSSDGSLLVLGVGRSGQTGTNEIWTTFLERITLFETASSRQLAVFEPTEPVSLAWGTLVPGGRFAAVLKKQDADELVVWDALLGGNVRVIPTAEGERLNLIALSPDGRLLAVKSFTEGGHQALTVWDPEQARLEHRHVFDRDVLVTAMGFSPDSGRIAMGTGDGRVILLELSDTFRGTHSLRGGFGTMGPPATFGTTGSSHVAREWNEPTVTVASVAFSSDGSRLAGLDKAGHLFVWDSDSEPGRRTLEITQRNESPPLVMRLVVDREAGAVVSALSDGSVVTVDLATGKKLFDSLESGLEQGPTKGGVVPETSQRPGPWLGPDGRLAAWLGESGELQVGDTQTGRLLRTLEIPTSGEAGDDPHDTWSQRGDTADFSLLLAAETTMIPLAFTPDGRGLIVQGIIRSTPLRVEIWESTIALVAP